MTEIVRIGEREILPVEYRGQRVLTLRQVDELHGRPDGTARRNFNENRERLREGRHYFQVPYEDWSSWTSQRNSTASADVTVRNSYGQDPGGRRGPLTALTEFGYLLLVKSFTDDLAWQIQEALVEVYFRAKAAAPLMTPEERQALTAANRAEARKALEGARALRRVVPSCYDHLTKDPELAHSIFMTGFIARGYAGPGPMADLFRRYQDQSEEQVEAYWRRRWAQRATADELVAEIGSLTRRLRRLCTAG